MHWFNIPATPVPVPQAREEALRELQKTREILKWLCKEPNSQSQLARVLGVTPQAVQKWVVRGYVPPKRAFEIEKFYGVPATNLVSPKQREILLTAAN